MISDDNEFVFFPCDCRTEGLAISFGDDEYDTDTGKVTIREFYFSLWVLGYTYGKMEWGHRLKLIWRILTKGRQFHDQLIFKNEQVKQIAKFLSENILNENP